MLPDESFNIEKYKVVSTRINFFWVGNWIYKTWQNFRVRYYIILVSVANKPKYLVQINFVKKIFRHFVKYRSKKTRPNILCAFHLTKVLTTDLQSQLCELLNNFFFNHIQERSVTTVQDGQKITQNGLGEHKVITTEQQFLGIISSFFMH